MSSGRARVRRLLAYLTTSAEDFERRAQGFVTEQIEEELNQRLSPEDGDKVKAAAAYLSEKLAQEIAGVEAMVKAGVPEFIAAVVAAMCRLDCAGKAALEARVNQAFQDHLAHLNVGLGTVRGLVEKKYDSILAELRHGITIFLANLLVMGLALAVAVFRGPAARQLLPIPIVLTAAVLLASSWYVFGQNRFLAIIFSDYVGWSYLVLVGFVCVLLWDIVLNRARITTEWMNGVSQLIGLPLALVPC